MTRRRQGYGEAMKGGENMTTLHKIGAAIATGALFATLATSAFASTTIIVSGNGEGSVNTAKTHNHTHTTFTQTNTTSVGTTVTQHAKTGHNTLTSNTGSGASVITGDATNTTDVTVGGGNNGGTSPTCCCTSGGDTSLTINGNGENSVNTAKVKNSCSQTVTQTNTTAVSTSVTQHAKTGGNTVSGNTGGTASVTTGDATNTVTVDVTGGDNTSGGIL